MHLFWQVKKLCSIRQLKFMQILFFCMQGSYLLNRKLPVCKCFSQKGAVMVEPGGLKPFAN